MEVSLVRWRKSSFSGGDNECVEVAHLDDAVAVRDSKNPDGPTLTVNAAGFFAAVKGGKFSH